MIATAASLVGLEQPCQLSTGSHFPRLMLPHAPPHVRRSTTDTTPQYLQLTRMPTASRPSTISDMQGHLRFMQPNYGYPILWPPNAGEFQYLHQPVNRHPVIGLPINITPRPRAPGPNFLANYEGTIGFPAEERSIRMVGPSFREIEVPRMPASSQTEFCRRSARGLDYPSNITEFMTDINAPVGFLFNKLEHMSDAIGGKIAACMDADQLVGYIKNLGTTIDKLQNIRIQTDIRIKEITKKDVPAECPVIQPKVPIAVSAEPVISLEPPPERQRKKGISKTIFVRKLPPHITEADLRVHFVQFCDKPSEVSNIKIPRDANKRSKGHAYVNFQHGHIVNKVFAQKLHYVKGTSIELLEYDEEAQQRNKRDYKIFVQGLSSCMSEKDFEKLLVATYGEVEHYWFRPSKNQPTISNACAFLSFKQANVNETILAKRHMTLDGRKYICKKYTQQKNYLEQKKKDGVWWDGKTARTAPHSDTAGDVGSSRARSPGPSPQSKDSKPPSSVADECKVCLDRTTCMLLKPCRHFGSCEECAKVLTECPFCRTPIQICLRNSFLQISFMAAPHSWIPIPFQ
ncbi:hypothetical protein RvY_02707-2 [Ramazzottius varieornatus]|uniref:RING-type domain-containing protein n=1 Tax=Ramazzottius varieornatus TaxID=947166 RepID=A0A1D1UKN8_RAMVA|nr:hypothetical protein RvY_02707-2 [Ramazzottius varieornatus]